MNTEPATIPPQSRQFEIPKSRSPFWSRFFYIVLTVVILAAIGVGVYFAQKKFFEKRNLQQQQAAQTTTNTTTNVVPTDNTVATPTGEVSAQAATLIDKVTFADMVSDDFTVTGATTTFPTDQKTVYLLVQTKNIKDGTQVKMDWYYKTGATFIDSASFTAKRGINSFVNSLPEPTPAWPEGDYEVKVYLDGSLAKIATFTVKAQ